MAERKTLTPEEVSKVRNDLLKIAPYGEEISKYWERKVFWHNVRRRGSAILKDRVTAIRGWITLILATIGAFAAMQDQLTKIFKTIFGE